MRPIGHLDAKSFIGPMAYVAAAHQLQSGPVRRIEPEGVVKVQEGAPFFDEFTRPAPAQSHPGPNRSVERVVQDAKIGPAWDRARQLAPVAQDHKQTDPAQILRR